MIGKRIAVIGAGIVGCATALRLTDEGFAVTVFDPDSPGANTSSGNAGVISTGGITPNATPGLVRSLPAMALDSQGDGWIRRGDMLRSLPWLRRMVAVSQISEVRRIAAAMHPLVAGALDAHRRLAVRAGRPDLITVGGWMKVYGSAAAFAAAALDRELMTEHGVDLLLLNAQQLRDRLPNVDRAALHAAVHQPGAGLAANPQALSAAYLEAAIATGAEHRRERIIRAAAEAGGVTCETEKSKERFDRLVVCAGARSAEIAAWFGDRALLVAERGYHAQFPVGTAALIPGPTYFSTLGFVLSPMARGLRLTMGAELSRPGAPRDYRRLNAKIETARKVVRALGSIEPGRWMGERPSTPDTLPVIGRSPRAPAVCYAFGHGHLGLTMAATTADLVARILTDRTAPDAAACSIERFDRRAGRNSSVVERTEN